MQQELGELEGAGGDGGGAGLEGRIVGEDLLPVPADHAGAGAGGHHDGVVAGEQVELGGDHLARFVGEAAGEGRLAAAGLVVGKDHADAFALEQGDGVHAGFGHKHVHQAGSVEIHRLGAGG
jgi:hypothetical protein